MVHLQVFKSQLLAAEPPLYDAVPYLGETYCITTSVRLIVCSLSGDY